jgi:hypothetical protein
MKTFLSRLLLAVLAATVASAADSASPASPARAKGPTSKIFLAETKGETQIQNGDKIYTAQQATAFDAPGTIIQTKAKSHDALVYSNGTGLFVDESTRVEISRFTQAPFAPDPNNTLGSSHEPSVSHSNIALSYGAIGICTNQLISGSSMLYTTPFAAITIRGGKVAIESTPDGTIVDLLEGDITVRAGEKDIGGQVLRAGERAIIRPPAINGQSSQITIQPMTREEMAVADRRVEMACNARRSVTFGIIQRKAEEGLRSGEEAGTAANGSDAAGDNEAAGAAAPDQQIVAQPTVPANPPNNIVISPDRLPGT